MAQKHANPHPHTKYIGNFFSDDLSLYHVLVAFFCSVILS